MRVVVCASDRIQKFNELILHKSLFDIFINDVCAASRTWHLVCRVVTEYANEYEIDVLCVCKRNTKNN